jgi:hypothetical protein
VRRAGQHAENLALYLLVCAFWGLVLYEAPSVTLR